MKTKIFLLTFLLNTCIMGNALAQTMPFVYSVENTGANYPKPILLSVDQLPIIRELPDPFAWADGRGRISNFSDWRYRRAEIKAQIENYEIGEKPSVDPSQVTANYSSNTLTVNVTVNGRTLTLTSQVSLPTGTGPFPAVIGMNSPSGSIPSTIFTSRNIAQIRFNLDQVTSYNTPQNTNPYYQLYPYLNLDNTGQYSAWAWGVSRIIDGLELVQNTLPIDLKHIAVTGCSYAGKLAIFAGAFDERIALTIGQESGGGGYTTWRYSEEINKIESVETLGKTNYSWFRNSMSQFSSVVSKLPEDHHELMAMVAPRALLVTGNPGWTWLADESGYVGSKAAKEVWKALGVPDRFGYSQIGGHNHCAVPNDQTPEIEAFVDKFLLGKDTVNTNVATSPYTTNLSPWITWTTPTLANGTSFIEWASLNYPSNLQTGMDKNITFKWNKVGNTAMYFIHLSTDPTFTNTAISDSTTTDTVKTITSLLEGKRYYWRIQVKNNAGSLGPWSDVWNFTTFAPLPAKPQLVAPTPYPGRSGWIIFKWNKVKNADQYFIQIADNQTFPYFLATDSTTSDTAKTISGFYEGQIFYWRVQAKNISGFGPWSDVLNHTVDVKDVKRLELPTEYSVSQNYPNPFNPSTTISFDLPAKSFVLLKVFDALGKEVATIVSEELSAGTYSRQWNADGMPSGVYFYRLQAGTYNVTKKLVLLR